MLDPPHLQGQKNTFPSATDIWVSVRSGTYFPQKNSAVYDSYTSVENCYKIVHIPDTFTKAKIVIAAYTLHF